MAARKTAKRATAKLADAKLDVVNSAQQIWLAGLGAMARAQREGPKLFKSLVAEGGKVQRRSGRAVEQAVKSALDNIQSTVGERVAEAKGKAQDTWDNVEKIFQSRVQKAIRQLGMPTAHEIHVLANRVEELAHNVEKLSTVRTKSAVSRARSAPPLVARSSSANGPMV